MADVASLAVALHLNAATFKSQINDAFTSASNSSNQFSKNASNDANNTSEQLIKVSEQAKRTGASFTSLGNSAGRSQAGFQQLRTALTNVSSGANVASSSLLNAFIPALERSVENANQLKMSLVDQRQSSIDAAKEAANMASAQITQSKAARETANGQFSLAQKMRDEAIARRELAIMQDTYLATQVEINKQYGIQVDYSQDHAKNSRIIKEANIAEDSAKKKMAEASQAVLSADIQEASGKKNLLSATNQLNIASKELTVSQRAAATASGLLKNTLSMLGGPIGVGLMAAAGAVTYLYTQYQKASEQQKAFTVAIQKGGAGVNNSVYQLRMLANQLGGTTEAYKSVAATASAGFSGSMLRDIAEFGTQIEKSGGSVDHLISKLTSINEQPLQSLRQLINEGLVFDEATLTRIALLERQGEVEEAKELARRSALNASKTLNQEQTRINKLHEEGIANIEKKYRSLTRYMDTSSYVSAQVQISALNAMNREKSLWQIGTTLASGQQEQQQKAKTKSSREELDVQIKLNSAYGAGADKAAEKTKLQQHANEQLKAGKLTQKEYEQTLKGLDQQFSSLNKKAREGVSAGLPEGQRRIEQLREQTATLRAQLVENEKLTTSEGKLVAFEQELVNLKGQKLNTNQKSILANASVISAQLQVNAELEKEIRFKEQRKKFDDQNFEVAQRTLSMQQEAKNQLLQVAMPTVDYDRMLEEQRIRDDFRSRHYQLDKEVTDKTSQLYIEQTAKLNEEQQRQLDIVRQSSADKAALEKDWQAGIKRGWLDFGESTRNTFDQMRNISAAAFNGMTGLFTDFTTTGKADFSHFARSFLTDISKMIIQMTILNGLKSGLGGTWLGDAMGISVTPNAIGGVYGSPGLSAYSNGIVSSPTPFLFAKGGAPNVGVMGEAGDEAIIPLKRGPDGNLGVRAFGNRSSSQAVAPQVYITIESGGNQQVQASAGFEQFGSEVGGFVDRRFRELMNREVKPGGTVWNMAKGAR